MKRSLKLALRGVSLFPADVKELEAKLVRRPTNHSARCQLLGYYWCKQNLGLRYRRKLEEHALFVIANLPAHELAGSNLVFLSAAQNGSYVYESARDLWIGHLETSNDNIAIITNASKFFAAPEPEVARAICLTGKSLEPGNPQWSKRLASLYEYSFVPGEHDESIEAEWENALALSPAKGRSQILSKLARFAYNSAGNSQKAVQYSETIIDTNKGKRQKNQNWLSLQSAYAILGRISLANLDLPGTRKYFSLACASPKAMPIMIIGTELRSFLCELAASGETRYVDEVLSSCRAKPDNMWLNLLEFGSNPVIFYRYSDYSFIFESMQLSWSGLPCYETSAELGRALIGSQPRSISDFSQIKHAEDSMRGKSPQQVWDIIREA
ncbi:MAG: hypothetical protein K8F91_02125, partial [Candidatus Obscuribacterales bacterium]|nr:hypothetical protein [Candidatus Obscuribacterales bacterium]